MKRFRRRKNSKISKFYLWVVTLIFFFTSIFFNLYSKTASNNLIDVAFIKLNEFMDSFLSNNINYDLLKDDVMKDIIVINKNKDGEILLFTLFPFSNSFIALSSSWVTTSKAKYSRRKKGDCFKNANVCK